MKKISVGVFLLASTLISFATPNSGVLPLQFITGNNQNSPINDLPSTYVTIQGTRIPLILDTGNSSANLALTPAALKSIHINFTGKESCSNSLSGKICMKEFTIPSVNVAGFTLNNVPGQVMTQSWGNGDKNFVASEASKNGAIGLKLLSQFNVLVDYANKQAVLFPYQETPSILHQGQWVRIPFEVKGGILTVLKINHHAMRFIWDTGSVPSIINSKLIAKNQVQPCQRNWGFNETGCQYAKLQDLQFGKLNLPNTWAVLQNLPKSMPFDGLIGSNFFASHMVYFDFKRHWVYVKLNENSLASSGLVGLLLTLTGAEKA